MRTRRLGSRRLIQAVALASATIVLLACTEGTRTVTQPDVTSPTASPTAEVPDVEQPSMVPLARRHIKHVIFLIKENRSFDTLFGRFPGADGPAERVPLHRPDGSVDLIRLRPASDRTDDVDHNFISGLLGIRGGEMDGFGVLGGGNPLAPYVWYRKEQIPAYWAYAKRYELADRFFSAVYGPTGPEQLWSMSGSSAGFTSFESEKLPQSYGTGPPREYCDDPEERAYRFVRWRQARDPEVMAVEYESPRRLVNPRYWRAAWPCVKGDPRFETLPEQMTAEGSPGASTAVRTSTRIRSARSGTRATTPTSGGIARRPSSTSRISPRGSCRRSRG